MILVGGNVMFLAISL